MSSCVQGLMGEFAFDESPSAGKCFDRRNWGKGVSDGAPAACRDVEKAGRQRGPHWVRSSWRPHVSDASSPTLPAPGSLWLPHSPSQCCDRAPGRSHCRRHHQLSRTAAVTSGT